MLLRWLLCVPTMSCGCQRGQGRCQPPASKKISHSDPQARWTAAPGGPAFYAYSTNYLVDTDAGIIVDVEATPAHRTLEVQSTRTMIERVEERLALKTTKLIGDTAYGTAEFLGWMVHEKNIEPHVPVWEKGERNDGTFSRSDFSYEQTTDQYTCPAASHCGNTGKPLARPERVSARIRRSVITLAARTVKGAS